MAFRCGGCVSRAGEGRGSGKPSSRPPVRVHTPRDPGGLEDEAQARSQAAWASRERRGEREELETDGRACLREGREASAAVSALKKGNSWGGQGSSRFQGENA